MAPSTERTKNLRVHVARHNSQRIGPALTARVNALARERRIRTDLRQPTNDPASTIAQAIENASDWNAMLLTARAERGPQWDIGTQQFLVERDSALYFDPTPVRTHLKDRRAAFHAPPAQPPHHQQQQLMPPPHQQQPPRADMPYPHANGMPINLAPGPQRVMSMGPPQGMQPQGMQAQMYGAVPPGQFYGAAPMGRTQSFDGGMGQGMGRRM